MHKSMVIAILAVVALGGMLAIFHIVGDQIAIRATVVVISLLLVVSFLPDQARAWLRFRGQRSPQSFESAVEPDRLYTLLLTYKLDRSAELQLRVLLDDLFVASLRRRPSAEVAAVQERLSGARSVGKAAQPVLDDKLIEHSLRLLEDSWKLG